VIRLIGGSDNLHLDYCKYNSDKCSRIVIKQNTTKTCKTVKVNLHAFLTSVNDELQDVAALQWGTSLWYKVDKKLLASESAWPGEVYRKLCS
jgi:hypothetical protein